MAGISVVELAHKVPIVETIEQYIKLQPRNGKFYGLCPFHNDKRIGSFVVFPDVSSEKRGWFQCYACGEKGDNIDFVKNYLGVSTKEAAIIISVNAHLISNDDADILLGRKLGSVKVREPEKRTTSSEKGVVLAKKKDSNHLDRVYKCFAAASFPLTKELQTLLLEKRQIPASSLPKYFLAPARSDLKAFWPGFRGELSKEFNVSGQNHINDLLVGVPGFYINNNGYISFTADPEPRLGIKIFDRDGRVSGIQTRALEDRDGKGNRYKFLSSGYANGTDGALGSMGCSCGYIEDVLYPLKKKREQVIALTEGRFKAEILSALGYTTVNMHSISNWEPAGDVALALAEKMDATRFVLCYDREQNANVEASAFSLHEKLSPVLPTDFAIWNPVYGKGIDDVVIAGHLKDICRVPASQYFVKKAG